MAGEIQYAALQTPILTALARKFPIPDLPLARFFRREEYPTRWVKWYEDFETRRTAPYNRPGAEAHRTGQDTLVPHIVEVPPIREKELLSADDLQFAIAPGTLNTRWGEGLIARTLERIIKRIELRHERTRWETLTSQNVTIRYPDGTTRDAPTGVQSTHAVVAAGASWATASTDVLSDIVTAQNLIRSDGGIEATDMWCSSTTIRYLMENTDIVNWFGQTVTAAAVLANPGLLGQLLGLNIHVYNQGFANESDSFTRFLPVDYVVFTGTAEAIGATQYICPPADLAAGLPSSPGRFSKRVEKDDPSALEILVEDVQYPVLTNPDGVYTLDTVP